MTPVLPPPCLHCRLPSLSTLQSPLHLHFNLPSPSTLPPPLPSTLQSPLHLHYSLPSPSTLQPPLPSTLQPPLPSTLQPPLPIYTEPPFPAYTSGWRPVLTRRSDRRDPGRWGWSSAVPTCSPDCQHHPLGRFPRNKPLTVKDTLRCVCYTSWWSHRVSVQKCACSL